jgi:hypothetical protein
MVAHELNEKVDLQNDGDFSDSSRSGRVCSLVGIQDYRVFRNFDKAVRRSVYAHNWGFQCMVGAIYLVRLLAITAFVLAIERLIYGFFQPKR